MSYTRTSFIKDFILCPIPGLASSKTPYDVLYQGREKVKNLSTYTSDPTAMLVMMQLQVSGRMMQKGVPALLLLNGIPETWGARAREKSRHRNGRSRLGWQTKLSSHTWAEASRSACARASCTCYNARARRLMHTRKINFVWRLGEEFDVVCGRSGSYNALSFLKNV